jgi:hypothetical protein
MARSRFLVESARIARRNTRIRRAIWGTVLLLSLLIIVWYNRDTASPAARVEPAYAWAQLLPNGEARPGGRIVRAVVGLEQQCPDMAINGRPAEMRVRTAPDTVSFPVRLCEREVNESADVRVGSARIPVRPVDPAEMLVIGDTGCRLTYYQQQDCNDTAAWPFAAISQRAEARLRADKLPAIIVHVGDYHYRERPCSGLDLGCAGSPHGDNWASWRAEFFDPAGPLLLAAPWVMLRGNHENCARAGAGWQFFFGLAAQQLSGVCQEDGKPYELNIGGAADRPRVMLVLDTANAGDKRALRNHCDDYPGWLTVDAPAKAEIWLALHQPLWLYDDGARPGAPRCEPHDIDDAVDAIREVIQARTGARFFAALSGDTHQFQVFRPDSPDLPVQIVAGDSGTRLDDLEVNNDPLPDGYFNGTATSHGVQGNVTAIKRFGFTILSVRADHWTATLYGADGREVTVCDIGTGTGSSCTGP